MTGISRLNDAGGDEVRRRDGGEARSTDAYSAASGIVQRSLNISTPNTQPCNTYDSSAVNRRSSRQLYTKLTWIYVRYNIPQYALEQAATDAKSKAHSLPNLY